MAKGRERRQALSTTSDRQRVPVNENFWNSNNQNNPDLGYAREQLPTNNSSSNNNAQMNARAKSYVDNYIRDNYPFGDESDDSNGVPNISKLKRPSSPLTLTAFGPLAKEWIPRRKLGRSKRSNYPTYPTSTAHNKFQKGVYDFWKTTTTTSTPLGYNKRVTTSLSQAQRYPFNYNNHDSFNNLGESSEVPIVVNNLDVNVISIRTSTSTELPSEKVLISTNSANSFKNVEKVTSKRYFSVVGDNQQERELDETNITVSAHNDSSILEKTNNWCLDSHHYVVYSWILCMVSLAAFLKLNFLVKASIVVLMAIVYNLLIFIPFYTLFLDPFDDGVSSGG